MTLHFEPVVNIEHDYKKVGITAYGAGVYICSSCGIELTSVHSTGVNPQCIEKETFDDTTSMAGLAG